MSKKLALRVTRLPDFPVVMTRARGMLSMQLKHLVQDDVQREIALRVLYGGGDRHALERVRGGVELQNAIGFSRRKDDETTQC